MATTIPGRVFVTGGAGFLARAIYRRAERERWPTEFTAFSRDDAKHARLTARFPHVHVARGSVAEGHARLADLLRGHDVVLHLAAAKFVDLSEFAAWSTVETNVVGSMNVINAAMLAEVDTVIATSTDKAASPVNTYGATKFVMERLIQDFDFSHVAKTTPITRLLAVRYGNVIGSTGSVIPKFRDQFRRHGEVTVTNPEMTRFWMTAEEAIDCILAAWAASPHATVTIPAAIRSMKLIDVVHAAIGTVEPVKIVGTRPGEKVHESLITPEESLRIDDTAPASDGYHRLLSPRHHLHDRPWSMTSASSPRMTAAEMAEQIRLIEEADQS